MENWKIGIGKEGDWEIGKLGDWEIGKLGNWKIGKWNCDVELGDAEDFSFKMSKFIV